MADHYTLTYRGHLRGLASHGQHAVVLTHHPEQQATALYRIDWGQAQPHMETLPLPAGGTALLAQGDQVWLTDSLGQLWHTGITSGNLQQRAQLPTTEASPIIALARLADQHLAVLQPRLLTVLACGGKKAGAVQTVALTEDNTALAADPTGAWLALGDQHGNISTWQWQAGQLQHSASAALHQGRVTAIQFEAHELRFYSAGADKKLLNTHAQGALQALDKGRNSNHGEVIRSILLAPGERFYTGADDKSVKAWPYAGGQPATQKEDLHQVLGMAVLSHLGQPHLLVAGKDASLRLIKLTADGKCDGVVAVIQDGYHWAKQALQDSDPARREAAVDWLTAHADRPALDLLARQLKSETDKTVRERMVERVSRLPHARVPEWLENCLTDNRHESVRQKAFTALLSRSAADDPLRPLEKAIASGFNDIGEQALLRLAEWAPTMPRAEQMLLATLQGPQTDLRFAALRLLEGIYAADDPRAALQALHAPFPELQRAALIRLYQRRLQDHPSVAALILQLQDHNDPQLRQTAFWVRVLGRPALAAALRGQSRLTVIFQMLEDYVLPGSPAAAKSGTAKSKPGAATKVSDGAALTPADTLPLLQGMTSRHADIALNACLPLALLHDQRALGMLLMLCQASDPVIRVGVCQALAALQQAAGVAPLQMLLRDGQPEVRDAAFSALLSLMPEPLLVVRQGFAARQPDMATRALKTLLEQPTTPETLALLQLALDDPHPAVRQEAFKACRNRQLGGNTVATLQLLLHSLFEDIHGEVLSEWKGLEQVAEARQLLPSLLDDPFASIRLGAFAVALEKKKRFERDQVLQQALQSRHVDVRGAVLNEVSSKFTASHQRLQEQLLADDDRSLRQRALQQVLTLTPAATLDAVLATALTSPHGDIRREAALACARLGDARAYDVLQPLADAPPPAAVAGDEAKRVWQTAVLQALEGMANLGDARAFAQVVPHLGSSDGAIRKLAAQALPWVSTAEHIPTLVGWLRHDKDEVRIRAAQALALLGDERADGLLNDSKQRSVLTPHEQLACRLCRGHTDAAALQPALTQRNTATSSVLVLAALDLLSSTTAERLRLALTLARPDLQLISANLLLRYDQPEDAWQYLAEWLTQQKQDDDKDWRVTAETVQSIAQILVAGQPRQVARLLDVLALLDQTCAFDAWTLRWTAFCRRYGVPAVSERPADAAPALWQPLAFGALLGLIRQAGSAAAPNLALSALRSLNTLAQRNPSLHDSTCACLLALLNHGQAVIRQQAFALLPELGVTGQALGQAALASPFDDIAERGLDALLQQASPEQAQQTLTEQVIQGRPALTGIAHARLSVLMGRVPAAAVALTSYHLPLRLQVVTELAAAYAEVGVADLLLTACGNDHRPTAGYAAQVLAQHRHPAALARLRSLLWSSQEAAEQAALVQSIRG